MKILTSEKLSSPKKDPHSKKRKRVVLLVKSVDGGTGAFVLSLQKLQKYNFDITTVVLEAPSHRNISGNNVKFFHKKNFYPQKYAFLPSLVSDFIKDAYWFYKINSEIRPSVVIAIDVHCNLISLLVRFVARLKFKIIFTTHINLKQTIQEKSTPLLRKILSRTISTCYNHADILVCSSELMKRSLRREYGIKKQIKLIEYGVDSSFAARQHVKKEDRFKQIVSVGRLVEQKDFSTLIKAFRVVNDSLKNTRLSIVGEGPLRRQLEQEARKMGLNGKVVFRGWKQNVILDLVKADIFVLSSKREGLPYVLLEALSVGLPIVSTDSPFGPSEILENGKSGILVKVGDVQGMAKSIIELIQDNRKYNYFAKKSIERSRHFSEERMIYGYKVLVDSLEQ